MKSLELYVHIPFCMRKCEYCDFLSFPADDNTQFSYINALLAEIRYYSPMFRDYTVTSIYIGGGTPSWLDAGLIAAVLSQIGNAYNIHPAAEISMECNPGTVTEEKLRIYMNAGINRLSIGLQSPYDDELQKLGRIHNFEQFVRTYEMSRNVGLKNINIDLMSGLPGQKPDKFIEGLHRIIRMKPEHLSVYSLIIEKGTPFYDKYKFDMVKQEAGMETEELPTEDEVYRIIKMTQHTLKQAGYIQYEISNFARAGYECQHNIGYWTRGDYLGLGLGAASLVENVRYSNTRDLYGYIEGCMDIRDVGDEIFKSNLHQEADPVSRQAQMEEFMFLGLRMNSGVSRRDFEASFGIPIDGIYRQQMDYLKKQGLLEMKEGRIYLTDRGMDLSNYCMEKFLL